MTRKEALELVSDEPDEFKNLPAKFKKDKEIVLAAIESANLLYAEAFGFSDEGESVVSEMHDNLKKTKSFY